jgi:hypothetical protein
MPLRAPSVAASVMRRHSFIVITDGLRLNERFYPTASSILSIRELSNVLPGLHANFAPRIKTRIQADSANGRSVRALLKRILKEEGITGFYRGFGATMLNTFSMRTPSISSICSFKLLTRETQ